MKGSRYKSWYVGSLQSQSTTARDRSTDARAPKEFIQPNLSHAWLEQQNQALTLWMEQLGDSQGQIAGE